MSDDSDIDDYAIAEIVPDHILENIFSFLRLKDLRNCSVVCKSWHRVLNEVHSEVWRSHCLKKMSEEALRSDLLVPLGSYKSKLRAFCYAWNPFDCSRNVYIKPNGFTLHR